MFNPFRSLFSKPLTKVARASIDAVPTQAIANHRRKAETATINGLLASVDDDTRERYEARLAEILSLGGSA